MDELVTYRVYFTMRRPSPGPMEKISAAKKAEPGQAETGGGGTSVTSFSAMW